MLSVLDGTLVMASAETPGAREERLFKVSEPHLRKLLHDAPPFGSIKLELVLAEDDIARIVYGAEVSRKLAPHTRGL
jgi:hypothetical protein